MSSSNADHIDRNRFERLRPGPRFYLGFLVLVYFVAFVAHVRLDGVFACPATRYSGDHYLAHCETTGYGDYDHGAFWLDLEPAARRFAQAADALFVGNSRMQFGFSASAPGRWFASQDRNYYLLGFSHSETVNFVAPMLQELEPRARVYVVDADEFFIDFWSGPGRDVLHGEGVLSRYRTKRAWQAIHKFACQRVPICGDTMAFFRQRETGEWLLAGNSVGEAAPVDQALPLDETRVEAMRGAASKFVSALSVPRGCVIFTYVPPETSDRATMQALATAVGVPFVSPELTGLRTFDGSHLDRESAERFTAAFFQEAAALLAGCLAEHLTLNEPSVRAE